MSVVQIQEKEVKTVIVERYNYIRCEVIELKLNESVKIKTDFLQNSGRIVLTTTDVLEGDDYLNWGSDDSYITQWICEKYGLLLL